MYSASFLFSVNFASATWDAVKVSDLTMALFGCISFYCTLITFTSLVLSSGWPSKTHFVTASSESIVTMLFVFSKPQDRPNEITQSYDCSLVNLSESKKTSFCCYGVLPMKHEHFKLVAVSVSEVSDTDTLRTHVRHATWHIHVFIIFCFFGHFRDTSRTHVSSLWTCVSVAISLFV